MPINKRGFTLLELLIAAAIISVLVAFATQTFRDTASQTRIEDAKTRAKNIAMAARRFVVDFGPGNFSTLTMMGMVSAPQSNSVCGSFTTTEEEGDVRTLQLLVNCGYLDYRQYVVDSRQGDTAGANFTYWFKEGSPIVCFKVAEGSDKILPRYKGTEWCTDGERVWEET